MTKVAAVVFLALLIPVTASGQNPEAASKKLENRNIPWGADEFIDRARQGDTGVVELFLAAGMDPNVKDKDGRTALMWAAANGYPTIVRALLAAGADVKTKDKFGMTAIMKAAQIRYVDLGTCRVNGDTPRCRPHRHPRNDLVRDGVDHRDGIALGLRHVRTRSQRVHCDLRARGVHPCGEEQVDK